MNLLRSIPILLYLLMMVVLPHAHLASHAHECETEHPAGHELPAHDSCTLCHLLTLPAQTSETDISVQSALLSTAVVAISIPKPDRFHLLPRLARAPPFMTA